tara:strand:- start:217 stop:717 length:501 start_codon:yes stop_codon:yes gene_type:complete
MANHKKIYKLAETLVKELSKNGKIITIAESCTGGWVGKAITDVPKSSKVFGCGVITYANGAKESLLGVKKEILELHGSVSLKSVEEMAKGSLRLSGADIAVAVSGVAGPSGGTKEKPVGTVCFGWAVRDGKNELIDTACKHFIGDRDQIREASVAYALQGALDRAT